MKHPLTHILYTLALAVAFALGSTTTARAQDYQLAVGARVGYPLSLSARYFLNESDAVEAFLSFRPSRNYGRTGIGLAYQRHFDLDLDDELAALRWYAGAGASVEFFRYKDRLFGPGIDRGVYGNTGLGLSVYLGLAYPFDDLPLEVTLDVRPTIVLGDLYGSYGGFGFGGSLGVRYILGR